VAAKWQSTRNANAEVESIMIRIITIEREYGCGGGSIAKKVADRLGWTLWDQKMTSEIARLSHCQSSEVEKREERVDPLYYRLFKSILRGSFEGSLNLHRLQLVDSESILRITQEVTQRAASAGNSVIVGRGSQHFLRDRDDALRIFLYAPKEAKVRRLMAEGIRQAEAEESVRTVDADRAAFVERYFGIQWPNRSIYHAMLNTEMGDDTVIGTILMLKEELEAAWHASSSPHDSPRERRN
jgi:cytidylate kinase